jgi:uncharacterized membrane protein
MEFKMEWSAVMLVVLLACLVVVPATSTITLAEPTCQKYDLHMYGGQFGTTTIISKLFVILIFIILIILIILIVLIIDFTQVKIS